MTQIHSVDLRAVLYDKGHSGHPVAPLDQNVSLIGPISATTLGVSQADIRLGAWRVWKDNATELPVSQLSSSR